MPNIVFMGWKSGDGAVGCHEWRRRARVAVAVALTAAAHLLLCLIPAKPALWAYQRVSGGSHGDYFRTNMIEANTKSKIAGRSLIVQCCEDRARRFSLTKASDFCLWMHGLRHEVHRCEVVLVDILHGA